MKSIEAFKRVILIAMSSICILLQAAVWGLFWLFYYHGEMYLKFVLKGHLLMIFVYIVLLLFFSQMYGGMKIGYLRDRKSVV